MTFGSAERNIAILLKKNNTFLFNEKQYKILISGKPTCKKGEPKTDIYVMAENTSRKKLEFKISFKLENADFIENKMNEERAKALLGENWIEIIKNSTLPLKDVFETKKLIFKKRFGHTQKGSITLGWKFELLNKSSGELSGIMKLSEDQVIDVYAGTHISDDKKNSKIENQIIPNSGIANYILIKNNIRTTQDVIDNLYTIDEYVKLNPDIYFACKALNYRTFQEKYDGNRPLSVFIKWKVENNNLIPQFIYNKPLITKGTEIANILKNCLSELNIVTTDDINHNFVENSSIIIE